MTSKTPLRCCSLVHDEHPESTAEDYRKRTKDRANTTIQATFVFNVVGVVLFELPVVVVGTMEAVGCTVAFTAWLVEALACMLGAVCTLDVV